MNLIKRNAGQVPTVNRLFFDDIFGRDFFNQQQVQHCLQ